MIYFSRRLSPAEQHYSNIEREALACVWCMERGKQLLLGTKFLLQTDHHPLEFNFNQRKALALKLMTFDFDGIYVKGNSIPHVYALSRLNYSSDFPTSEISAIEKPAHWVTEEIISWGEIQNATRRDRLLLDIIKRILFGNWSNYSMAERPNKMNRTRLMVEDSVIRCGECIAIPPLLRQPVLQMVHNETHCGVAATRNQLKLSAWWPGYCQDVETFISRCGKCLKMKEKTSTIHTWPKESLPWNRVHMDHACIKDVGLDAYSGWPEAIWVKDRSAKTVKAVLRAVFARQGVPKTLVIDNAAKFVDKGLMDCTNASTI